MRKRRAHRRQEQENSVGRIQDPGETDTLGFRLCTVIQFCKTHQKAVSNCLTLVTPLKKRSIMKGLHFAHAHTEVSNDDTVRPSCLLCFEWQRNQGLPSTQSKLSLSYNRTAMMWLFAIIYNIHNTFAAVNYVLLTVVAHP